MPARKIDPKKDCAACGVPLVRRRKPSGGLEDPDQFATRQFCSILCANRSKPKLTTEEYFWRHVDKSGGPDACWPWTAALTEKGYGHSGYGKAHRVAYELTHGEIPEGEGYHGVCVLHRCDNRPCCNPAHHFLGTVADNNHDMWAKGRGNKDGLALGRLSAH